MALIMWPASGRISSALQLDEGLEWDVEVNTMRSGRVLTRNLPGARWVARLSVDDDDVGHLVERRQLEALLVSLRGGHNRLGLWSLLTPLPLGTLQTGTPQVRVAMSAGANAVELKNCNGSFVRGDRIQFGTTGQRVMVTADTGAPVSTNLSVSFEPAARAAASVDSVITYDKPYTPYILRRSENVFPYRGNQLPGFTLELVEGSEA